MTPSIPSIQEEVIAPLNLSVTEAANRLAMSGVALSRVLNGKTAISPDLAVRLEKAGVSTARAWLSMQAKTISGKPCSTTSRKCAPCAIMPPDGNQTHATEHANSARS